MANYTQISTRNKQTDCHQYLHNTSCHPQHNKCAIPFSQALRYRRICSEDTNFSKHCHELQKNLIRRGYPKENILRDIRKATEVSREKSLSPSARHSNNNSRIPLVVTYHPFLPHLSTILKDHHHLLKRSTTLQKIFPSFPRVSYRRPKNLRYILVHSDGRKQTNCHTRQHQMSISGM